MTAVMPGQAELFPVSPAAPPLGGRWAVVGLDGAEYGPCTMLAIAAAVAHTVAQRDGAAWIVAADRSTAHVAPDGTVTPAEGWPATAARVIARTSGR